MGASGPRSTGTRTSTAGHVAAVLRDEILAGTHAPGAALPEVAVAGRFAVSRHTVREALRLLVHEGLARHHAHRGVFVTEHGDQDLADVCRARSTLELAAAAAVATCDESALGRLADPVTAMRSAAERGDGPGTVEADLAFHRRLVGLLGSTRLDAFYAGLQQEIRLGFAALDHRAPDPGKVAEHARLLGLAGARDTEGLDAALRAHLAATERKMRGVLRGAAT